MGNVTKRTDTALRQTLYAYDTANRLKTITDPDLKIMQFGYNARSQMTRVTDALTQVYNFSYDPLRRVLSQTRAGTTMSYQYDAVGNRTNRTHYIGRQTTYEYDALNRLKKINYLPISVQPPNLQVVYNYDALSRLTSAVNEAGTVSFTYDNRGRIQTTTDVYGKVLTYGYEANGNRNLLKLDGTNYAAYGYDDANRLTALTNSADNAVINFGYDNANKLTSRNYPNSVATTYEYDGMSRLTRLKDLGAMVNFDRQYSYNAASQIASITEPAQTRNFGYDNLDRLTSVTPSTGAQESYSFDAVGNRTASHRSASYTYQPFNRLTATATANYACDAKGNMTARNGMSGARPWQYFWDYENRLSVAWNGKTRVRYVYDALGRRVARYAGANGITKFTYDGADVLLDQNADGTAVKYLNGLGIDNKLRQTTGSTIEYFLADHLGSTNALVNASGAITSQTNYDGFGNQTANLTTRYGYTGRERDDVTGLMYYRARQYSPELGRFISEDPIGFKGKDINLYAYVKNKSVKFVDPSGNQRGDRDRPGDIYPGMNEPYNPNRPGKSSLSEDLSSLSCAMNNYNLWLTVEPGAALQFGPLGGADSIVIAFNPITQELCVYTKIVSGFGGSAGILATGGIQYGGSFGGPEGWKAGGLTAELFADASAFEGGSGSVTIAGGLGGGFGLGPTIGGGAAAGLRIGEITPLICFHKNNCGCKK